MGLDEKTQRAVEASKNAEGAQSGAAVQSGGKVSDDGGVEAILNPDRNAQEVAFPAGEGELDRYKAGKTHTVPRALLEIKDELGKPYLVEKSND